MAAHDKNFDIPKRYKAVVYDNPGTISTKIVEMETPEPGHGEVLVRITHSGVCHSDLAVMENAWVETMGMPPTPLAQIGGHEGVGVIHRMGPGTEKASVKLGDRVGIRLTTSVCGSCEKCLSGLETRCPSRQTGGIRKPGTFQQYVVSSAFYVTPIPDGLDPVIAAPMLCAGITVFSALNRCDTRPGQWVVISGAGGGLGHIACQLGSRGMAFRIIGVDHGSKEGLVRESGAEEFIDVTKFDDKTIAEEVKRLTGGKGATAAISCTSSNRAYSQALSMLTEGGTLVCAGVPEGTPQEISGAFPSNMIGRCLTIRGVSMGNKKDAIEIMDFAARRVVKPHCQVEKMENLTAVFKEMSEGKLMGRVVLDLLS
ncbi:alcohol dehydrogenase-like protein [Viridothelium virens]|uniref:Alcohol dehydrogenase-like protein n=1 Tax=Viridothelium virens TaxID=1048519 RepID=A0A6A6HHZ0_VIRVR|nr:alcohol dehydrogenase-like protein [Viridothelium virens]